LSADDLSAAQGALDDYARAFPEGVLRPEAAGIAAIVTCRRAPNARVVWEFSKQYPGSPLVERVRRSCDPASNK
jgi:hypothetical protein